MGAVIPGRAKTHARTAAGDDSVWVATSSRATRIRKPLSFSRGSARTPRGLLPRSARERYFPVRKPAAREE
jgi:hypothetical protein